MAASTTAASPIRQLLQEFDDTPPDQMDAAFYAHAYNELDLAVHDLLEMVDPNHEGSRSVEPAGGLASQIRARFAGLHVDLHLPERAGELPRLAPFNADDDTGEQSAR